ncbi:unnamed protein product [Tilletia controversa]|uniref:Uncharacterized protein n=1 Tax=Tilletia controversa TaxID=13291 RepID=A0A8X7MLD8_9BASI|nr:hypothetical protein CF328_g6289 [Tilletia controversa]KAE8240280.1 hypothetical protein A4X06_0g7833 [Tilletia controversa]CAD6960390.1 unnamed protein product [Tilletia controversa]CAD6980313.1 unnamed protein product [Tilletia controversa]
MSPATHSAGMKLKLKQAVVISLFWLSSSIAASVPAPGAGARGSSPLRLSKGFKPHSPSPAAITNMAEFGTVANQAMLVHDIIDRARANDNVIAVEDTHRFGNYSMRDALSYIDAFMDKGEAQIMWPKSDGGLVKRTCEGADDETCDLPKDSGFCNSLRTNICGIPLPNTDLIYGALTAVAVIGAIGYLPAAFYNRKAATFAAMTAAKLNENKYYWVVKNGEAIADGTLSVDGYSATYDACAGVGQDEAILVTRALSNSEAENHVDQIQQGFADIIGNLVDCGQNNGIGTLDAHGSWWVEFQIAGAQGCQQACGY